MSGDVFGNGMLLSERIRLVGAYDHRHVFIDPDPDRGVGLRRAQAAVRAARLDAGTTTTARKISEGGGVWPRSAKSIPLSPQVRAALGVEDERLAPTEVIRAILRAPVDLLWNGGIGTVVKASTETRRGRDGPRIRRDPRRRARPALPGRGRGRQPRPDAPRAGRVRARRRPRQRRLHRQLGRRRLLRPRGQPEDPARARRAARRARPRRRATSCCATSPTRSSSTCSTTRSCRRRSSPRRSSSRPRGCTPTRT